MNKKITVKTQSGSICYFIIDDAQNIEAQLARLHGQSADHGITFRMTETQIQMVDYYCHDVIGSHLILSTEDTTEPVSLQWHPVNG